MGETKVPTDQQAEMGVIGAMMNSEEALDEVMSIADEDFFYYDTTRKVFRLLVDLSNTARPDSQAVLKRLEDTKERALVRQADQMWNGMQGFRNHLRDLTETYRKRQFYYIAHKALQMTQETSATSEDISNVMEKGIGTISFEDSREDIIAPKQYATEGLELFRQRFEKPEEAYGIRLSHTVPGGHVMGFPSLDDTFMGLRGGDLILLAAQSGHGKTALAQNLSRIMSVHQTYVTYYENTEMSVDEMRVRLVSQLTQVPATEIMTGRLTGTANEIAAKYRKVEKGYELLGKSRLYLSRIPMLTPHKSRGLARRFRLKYGKLDALVIDYLGRMELENSQGLQEWQMLYEITKQCKTLAVQLDIPVILLSQLTEEGKIEGARKIKNECDGVLFFEKVTDSDDDALRRGFFDEEKAKMVNYKLVKYKVRRNDNATPIWCQFHKPTVFINEVVPDKR
ncbi:DnaB-like helicase C-terminal domain-containing protein [Aneurinibacillus thermoaerophilus]|nr:DnaB-like helicase C-terminal domain-containing protein [Aneurinibacillus thermoaerophilus]MED0676963.1 DnaB-like helicase C-terminal domain-containing protein [Aneurinibacillus thermoaerophilus]